MTRRVIAGVFILAAMAMVMLAQETQPAGETQTSQPAAETQATQPAESPNRPLAEAVAAAKEAKDADGELEASGRLEDSATRDELWAANSGRPARLLWQAGRRAEAITWLEAKAASCAADVKELPRRVRQQRRLKLLVACDELRRQAGDTPTRIKLAAAALKVYPTHSHSFNRLFNLLVAAKRHDEALAACLDQAGKSHPPARMRQRRMELLASLGRSDECAAEAVELLKVAEDPSQAMKAFAHALPADDVSLCAGLSAQQVLDGYKVLLRRRDGRLNTKAAAELATQLTTGGEARPLRVSDEAKALAPALKDAPLEGLLTPLLEGDHAKAFRYAFARARATSKDGEYIKWINAAAGALRCMEQSYNGKALQFVRYVNGELEDNPVAELMEE